MQMTTEKLFSTKDCILPAKDHGIQRILLLSHMGSQTVAVMSLAKKLKSDAVVNIKVNTCN